MNERGIDWRRISRGLYWIGFGTLLLLNTIGTLPWSVWVETAVYWPVLLVAAGLTLVFERSRVPALMLLSPLLVLGTLAWVATAAPRDFVGEWNPVEADRSPESTKWALDGDLAFARVDVHSTPLPAHLLVNGRVASRHRPSLRVRGSAEQPRVEIGRRDHGWAFIGVPLRREHWEFNVTEELPMLLDFDTAFTSGDVDLASTPVERVNLDGAFSSLTLHLGSVEEKDVRVYLRGAFNDHRLIVPRSTPVRIRSNGFLARVSDRRGAGSPDGPGYRVYLNGAFSQVVIHSD